LKNLEKHSLIEHGETTLSPYSTETDNEPNMSFASTLNKLAVAKRDKPGPETWDKAGEFERLVTAQFKGLAKPRMTLREAQRVYIKAKRRKPTVARIDTDTKRVVEYLCDLMKKENPFLWEINREIARQFRDKMIEEGSSPATVMRRISSIKPVIQHIIREQLEEGLKNHFAELPVEELREENEKDKREALTITEIAKVVAKLETKNRDLQDIWVLLTLTGARGNEICGLVWDDVILDHETPHIWIRPNSIPGTKNKTKRGIPLVGAALETLRISAKNSKAGEPVFPRYAKPRGADAASTILVKTMKQAGVWVKVRKVPYSLRHAHKDWMTRVAPADVCMRIHDHSGGTVASNYGSDDFLDILKVHLTKAMSASKVNQLTYPWVK
jgi:integrase